MIKQWQYVGWFTLFLFLVTIYEICQETIFHEGLGEITPEENLEFQNFQERFNKKYESYREYLLRQEIFVKNLRKIKEENSIETDYQLSLNEMSDWTQWEIDKLLMKKLSLNDIFNPNDEEVEIFDPSKY